jgi:lipopolysaccharide transport system permease protein
VFTCVFSVLLKTESGDGTPYPIFLYVGLLPWQYFSGTLTNAAGSVVTNSALVQKVYFPRLIIPAAAAVTSMVDTAVACLVLAVLMVYYGFSPHLLGLLAAPVLLVTTVFAALGMGLYVAALNVKFRDVRHALPFFIQIAMYVTPVVYPINMLDGHPAAKALMLWLNPMSGVISNARAGILGRSALDWNVMAISLLMSAVFMAFGLCYFRYMERHFADIV